MVDIIRLVDIDTDVYKMEDGSVIKIYTWFCHLHMEDMSSLVMHTSELDAAMAAVEHIKSH